MPYWSAWWRLRWDRDTFTSGIPFPIRFTSIDAYATRYGIGGHAFDTLLYLVREMDDEYVSIEANRVSPREDG